MVKIWRSSQQTSFNCLLTVSPRGLAVAKRKEIPSWKTKVLSHLLNENKRDWTAHLATSWDNLKSNCCRGFLPTLHTSFLHKEAFCLPVEGGEGVFDGIWRCTCLRCWMRTGQTPQIFHTCSYDCNLPLSLEEFLGLQPDFHSSALNQMEKICEIIHCSSLCQHQMTHRHMYCPTWLLWAPVMRFPPLPSGLLSASLVVPLSESWAG